MTPVNLREWETLSPEPGNALYRVNLVAHPKSRRLAEELTKTGRIEVLELARGLQLRATSFVGRFVIGGLTVTVHPKIPDAPLLNLFRYAYGLRNLDLYDAADFSSSKLTFQDLLVQQLAAEVTELLERGIHREYESTKSDLSTPRGRIHFSRYFDTVGRAQTTLPCTHHPRSEDTLVNRALFAGLHFAAGLATDPELKSHVRRIVKMFGATVRAQPITHALLDDALRATDRRTSTYKPAFTLIALLLGDRGVTLDDRSTEIRVKGFLFDMNRFFQALLSRFLREHLDGVQVQDELRLKGTFKYLAGQNPLGRREPILRPDFVVLQRGRMLAVLDAKYRDLWTHSLPRDMLYQLAIYALGRISGERTSAILYPTVDSAACEQQISIQEPVHGVPQATIALRPVNLLDLDQLLCGGATLKSQRLKLAKELSFGSTGKLGLSQAH